MEIKDIRVFVCVSGVGKTYLAKKDKRFVDMDDLKMEYRENYEKFEDKSLEKDKYYVNEEELDFMRSKTKAYLAATNKILLFAPNKKVVDMLNEEKILYCLIDNPMNKIDDKKCAFKIELKRGEFLSAKLISIIEGNEF